MGGGGGGTVLEDGATLRSPGRPDDNVRIFAIHRRSLPSYGLFRNLLRNSTIGQVSPYFVKMRTGAVNSFYPEEHGDLTIEEYACDTIRNEEGEMPDCAKQITQRSPEPICDAKENGWVKPTYREENKEGQNAMPQIQAPLSMRTKVTIMEPQRRK